MPRMIRRILLFVSLVLVMARLLPAQSTYTAQLTGTVTDSSGAVVGGAKLILVDEATNVEATTVTDDRGVYVFTEVRPATYSIRVEAVNFASQERKGLVLAVSQ